MIVDTSNEIGGDGDIPHPGIGHARRMQVPAPELQHAVMIEAVENHMPEVVVIDEIGTEAEALAARTIAERGVQLIATAHGNTLENLVANPTLSDLVGGIQAVTLGDDEARRRRTQKTVLERKAPPTFDVVIEIRDRDRFAVHHDVAAVVDRLLRNAAGRARGARPPRRRQRRRRPPRRARRRAAAPARPPARARPLRIFPYALRRDRVERAIRALQVPAVIADAPAQCRRRADPARRGQEAAAPAARRASDRTRACRPSRRAARARSSRRCASCSTSSCRTPNRTRRCAKPKAR